jgi:hypothetical protein
MQGRREVRRHSQTLGIERYVQSHAIDPELSRGLAAARDSPDPYDGVAELWFDLDVLAKLPANPERIQGGMALLEDERRFIDLPRSPIFLVEDHVIIG